MSDEVIRVPDDGRRRAVAPVRPDGSRYRFELIEPDGRWRAYSDDPAQLMGQLVPGYLTASPEVRLRTRTGLAVQAQVLTQAGVLARTGTEGCDDVESAVLLGDRETPPEIEIWSAPVPLLLVEGFYAPDGPLARPTAIAPGEIVWVDPRDDEGLLRSLHELGWLVLAEIA